MSKKQIIVSVVAAAVVVILGAFVALGLGGSLQEPANSAANAVNGATIAPSGNKAAENVATNEAPENETSTNESSADQAVSTDPQPAASASGSNQEPNSAPSSSASASPSTPSGSESSASSAPAPVPEPATITVSVYIDSSRAPGYPACMASTSVTIPAGSSVYDALRATGVGIGGSSTYVSSINGLAEKLPGHEAGSGWMYSVNGAFPNQSCGSYKLSGGESVRWAYTLDMGRDL